MFVEVVMNKNKNCLCLVVEGDWDNNIIKSPEVIICIFQLN